MSKPTKISHRRSINPHEKKFSMAQHMSQARKPSLMSLTPSNLKHLANVRHELEHSNNSTAFRGGKGIKTEIIMRKDKLTPAKLQHIKEATQSLSSEDVSLLTEIFNCGDGKQ